MVEYDKWNMSVIVTDFRAKIVSGFEEPDILIKDLCSKYQGLYIIKRMKAK